MASIALSGLLSRALVAFTLEFDNEFEHQAPHRTTSSRSKAARGSPWLVAMRWPSVYLRSEAMRV